MTQEYLKPKRDILLSKGWIQTLPQFNFDYFITNNSEDNIRNIGYYISTLSDKFFSNPLSVFGEESYGAYIKLLKYISPAINLPYAPVNSPCINATWPFSSQHWLHTDAAFEELTYRVIIQIINKLGRPNNIYQSIAINNNDDDLIFTLDTNLYNSIDDLTIVGKVVLIWKDVYVLIKAKTSWTENGILPAYEWSLYCDDIRVLSNSIMHHMGLELNSKTYQLGIVDPEFRLDSFPQYIKEYTSKLIESMNISDKCNNYPDRFNIIIEGPPGYGSHSTIAHN